jgi:hypothetical protein
MWTFDFAMDGKADMMSLNPLEMTNFEMMGAIGGIGGVLLTILLGRIAKRREQAPHTFVARHEDEGTSA